MRSRQLRRGSFFSRRFSQSPRSLRFESLEDRRLLSADPIASNSIEFVDDPVVQTSTDYGIIGEALWKLSESTDGSLYGMGRQQLETLFQYQGDKVAVEVHTDGDSAAGQRRAFCFWYKRVKHVR